MLLPNFLVIGAYKSGTTSIHRYLSQHPDVFMSPVKEPEFFALDGLTEAEQERERASPDKIADLAAYLRLFSGVAGETAIGESSPKYLQSARAVDRIAMRIPQARLVACLREPIEALYSNYNMHVGRGRERRPFTAVCRELERRREAGRTDDGLNYALQLQRYYRRFPRENIRVYLYEDLVLDPVVMMQDMFRFLGVDDAFVPDTSVHHKRGRVPKHAGLGRLLDHGLTRTIVPRRVLRSVTGRVTKRPDPLPYADARRLSELLRDDIRQLQELIDRDLSGWLR